MSVHSTEGVIEEVDVSFLVHGTCYTDSLFLATTQIDALQRGGNRRQQNLSRQFSWDMQYWKMDYTLLGMYWTLVLH